MDEMIERLSEEFGSEAIECDIQIDPFVDAEGIAVERKNDNGDLIVGYNELETVAELCTRYDYEYEVNFTKKTVRVYG